LAETIRLSDRRHDGDAAEQDGFASRALRSRELLVILVVIGTALRLAQYLANRSLWIDEAWLALNLLARSFGHLTTSLDFAQGAPLGFLFIEEAIGRTFGFSEYALRLFPLLSGIASLVAFAWLARRVLPAAAAPLALFLFAVADGLIYYSSELKPYAGDVTASVVLILAATKLAERDPAGAQTVLFAIGGLAAVFFSFPAAFLIAAIAVTLTVQRSFQGPGKLRLGVVLPVSVSLLGAIAVGLFALTRTDEIRSVSSQRFLGVSGTSSIVDAVNFFGTNLVAAMGLLQDPPFNQIQKLALLLVVAGIVSFLRRDRVLLSILLISFALTFLASAIHAYPLAARTELFLVPPIILLLVEGLARIVHWTPRRWRAPLAVILTVAVAAGPAFLAAKRLAHPRQREEIRPVLEFVRDHWQAGDTLYLYPYAQYAFLYYERCGCLKLMRNGHQLWPVRATSGPDEIARAVVSRTPALVVDDNHRYDLQQYSADLRRLKGLHRVWFVYSHVATPEEEQFVQHNLVTALNRMGPRLTGIDRHGAHAYLYEFRR
jgi:hypothetical protein